MSGQNSSNQESAGANAPGVACKTCKEIIKVGARKCIHCESYQDFTRYVARLSALIVAILAIAPLWNIAYSLSELAFTEKQSDIRFILTSCTADRITAAFANLGTVAGIVSNAEFKLFDDGKTIDTNIVIRPDEDQGEFVVSAAAAPVIVTYRGYIFGAATNLRSASKKYKSCQYEVTINFRDFKGHSSPRVERCTCPTESS